MAINMTDILTAMRKVDAVHDPLEANSILTTAAQEIDQLRAENTRLREALKASAAHHTLSANQFTFYVAQHLAKEPPDSRKALTNQEHATRCEGAAAKAGEALET